MRPMFQPCSPICVTQPIWTSSTSPGSIPTPLDEPVQHLAGELVAAQLRERAVPPPDRAANRVDDQRLRGHRPKRYSGSTGSPTRTRPGLLDGRVDAEVDRLAVADAAVALDQPQRVEVALARFRVARRHGAARHRPADAENRLADPQPAAVPGVLLVLVAAVEVEEHAEPPRVDAARPPRARGARPKPARRASPVLPHAARAPRAARSARRVRPAPRGGRSTRPRRLVRARPDHRGSPTRAPGRRRCALPSTTSPSGKRSRSTLALARRSRRETTAGHADQRAAQPACRRRRRAAKRRSSTTPARVSSTSSGCSSAKPLTGVTEIRATVLIR